MNTMHTSFLLHYFKRFYILISALTLIMGGMIYILFRTSEPVFYSWLSRIQLDGVIDSIKHSSFIQNLVLPEWIIYSLPNGLWAFGYAVFISRIWAGSSSWLRYIWIASIPVLIIGFEVLQYTNSIPGTFCIQDIALGLAGLISGIAIGININKINSYEKVPE